MLDIVLHTRMMTLFNKTHSGRIVKARQEEAQDPQGRPMHQDLRGEAPCWISCFNSRSWASLHEAQEAQEAQEAEALDAMGTVGTQFQMQQEH
jgi:hypothetical protein